MQPTLDNAAITLIQRQAWRLLGNQQIEWAEDVLPEPGDGQVTVRVAGCGLCHTDIGFYAEGVRPRHALPLVLGHEISGFVVAAGAGATEWFGHAVVVPAVTPCGTCEACMAGQGGTCPTQFMPGNDGDGGFATHVVVPARGLADVPGCTDADQPLGRSGVTLRQLSVLADAVSTPWQAIQHARLRQGDVAVVVGAGGVGGYAAQLAKAVGAHVVVLEVSEARRRAVEPHADLVFDAAEEGIRKRVRAAATARGWPATNWRIFECSGHPAGQRLAYDLLNPGATLLVIGFTREPVELRLSNLMAFDATARGTWGCLPEHYPAIVQMALDGAIDLASNTRLFPLRDLPNAFSAMQNGALSARLVLVPEL